MSCEQRMLKNKRNAALDLSKFLFAVVIVIFHAKNLTDGGDYLLAGGSLGVDFFFIVSGMLMANTADRSQLQGNIGNDTFLFMKRKIFGLCPNLYLAWIIAFIIEHIGDFGIKGMIYDLINSVSELLLITEGGFISYRANSVTWYIAAMITAMMLLYPLLRKYKEIFYNVVAPLLVIFLLGYTYQNWSHLRGSHVWLGWCYKSMVRAVMDITLGCLCFRIAKHLARIHFTRLSRVLWVFPEWGGMLAILYGCSLTPGKLDWIILMLIAAFCVMVYAQVSILDTAIADRRVFSWMGEFSFSLYLGHGFWSHKLSYLMPDADYCTRMPVYLILAFLTGLIIMYGSKALKYLWKHSKDDLRPRVRKIFIEEND